jgi:hypothetical protein
MNKMGVSKSRFMNYLKVQKSGKRNMFGYDFTVQKNYSALTKHFVDEKREEDFDGGQ